MEHNSVSRERKLVELVYPHFGKLAFDAREDAYAQRVCRHLLALKQDAIDDPAMIDIIVAWDRDHPEEDVLTNEDVLWVMHQLDAHMSTQLRHIEIGFIETGSTRARMRIINGGLSDKPDRPYPRFGKMKLDY